MVIASWNVNGLRAASKRGFLDWVQQAQPDVLCLQEVRATQDQLLADVANIPGYHSYFNAAATPGYSGVVIYTKQAPLHATSIVLPGEQFNTEGRTLLLEFDTFALLDLYLPHGGRDKSKLDYKLRVYQNLHHFVANYHRKPLILAGDFNVARDDIDLARPRQNRKNIMFSAEERSQIDRLATLGFIDTYRHLHPKTAQYTWWPWLADCRARNIGWRIDYIFAAASLQTRITDATILDDVLGSDHCPISLSLSPSNDRGNDHQKFK